MKARLEALPTALEMVIQAARLVTEDEWIHWKVVKRVLSELAEEGDPEGTSSVLIFTALQSAYRALGVTDPFENEKVRQIKVMAGVAETCRRRLAASADPLRESLRIALAGCQAGEFCSSREEAESAIAAALDSTPFKDESEALLRSLAKAERVLYLLDGAGEAVLDRICIEAIAKSRKVTVAARSAPILDALTAAEAATLGFRDIPGVTLIDTGLPMLGLSLENTGRELRDCFASADTVIAKGYWHHESLDMAERELYCMFRVPGGAPAVWLGASAGGYCLMRHGASGQE